MLVNFFATLRQVVGEKRVEFALPENVTVRQLIDEMLRHYPALRTELLDEDGQLYRHVHIFVNGRDSSYLENGLETVLQPEDTIGVFPAVGGG
ncbi:MAG: MoaD/ThiS family protein [Anaerolineales bacterium]|nr:MoaD/ThiS family protein [Anaerolineales bacterium]